MDSNSKAKPFRLHGFQGAIKGGGGNSWRTSETEAAFSFIYFWSFSGQGITV